MSSSLFLRDGLRRSKQIWNGTLTIRRPMRRCMSNSRGVRVNTMLPTPQYMLLLAQNSELRSTWPAELTRKRTGLKKRTYSTQSKPLAIEGKTEGITTKLWSKYKYAVIGVGAAAAAVGVLGVTVSAMAVGGLASLAGGMVAWVWNRRRQEKSVLKSLYEPILDENRAKLEVFIGPWKYPKDSDLNADSAQGKSLSGAKETIVRNVFQITGKYGIALVRVLGVQNKDDGSYSLRRLLVDASDFRNSIQHNFRFVEVNPVLDYVDAISYKTYTLSEYIASNRQKLREDPPSPSKSVGTTSSSSSSSPTQPQQKLFSNRPKPSSSKK